MASVLFINNDKTTTDIDYSLVDGRVRSFEHHGKILYDERENIAADNWKEVLVDVVKMNGLDIDRDGHGLHAFVYKMIEDGLLKDS